MTTGGSRNSQILLRVDGPSPVPDTAGLRTRLDSAGIDPDTVTVSFLPTSEQRLDADSVPAD